MLWKPPPQLSSSALIQFMILSVMVMSIGYDDGSEDDKDNNDEGMGYKMLIKSDKLAQSTG